MPSQLHRTVLAIADRSTKWLISSVTLAVVVAHLVEGSVAPAYYTVGACFTAYLGKALKKVLKANRPPPKFGDFREHHDIYGMPSSHATTTSFLAFAACVGLFAMQAAEENYAAQTNFMGWLAFVATDLECVGLLTASTVVPLLRVASGHHTMPQILAGWVLGTTMSFLCVFVDFEIAHGVDHGLLDAYRTMIVYVFATVFFFGGTRQLKRWAVTDLRRLSQPKAQLS